MRKIIPLLLTLLLVSSLVLTAFAVNEIDMTGIVLGKNPEPLDPKVEAMLAWALEIAADDSHGYSQSHRYGPNYDCSSFVCTALMEGGFGLEDYIFPGDMVVILPELGFVAYKKGETEPQRGDILVRPGVHVEICMGGLDCVSAHRDSDRRSGDGNGHEIEYRRAGFGDYNCPFCENAEYTYILRYEGQQNDEAAEIEENPMCGPQMLAIS
jgi:hypothetical protein